MLPHRGGILQQRGTLMFVHRVNLPTFAEHEQQRNTFSVETVRLHSSLQHARLPEICASGA
eukprot:4951841-Pyramimonas_sp.AAC.1